MTKKYLSARAMDALMAAETTGSHMAQIARFLHQRHLPFVWCYKEEANNLSTLRTIGDPKGGALFLQFMDAMSQLHEKIGQVAPMGNGARNRSIIEAAQYCVKHQLAARYELPPNRLKQHLTEGGVAIVSVAADTIVSHFEKRKEALDWSGDHFLFLAGYDSDTNEVLTNENAPVHRIPWEVFLKSWKVGEQDIMLIGPQHLYRHKSR